jgi:lysyl-tRNA synthetase, class II
MATLQDFRNERLKKLEQLKRLGVNPYPAKVNRTHKNAEIKLSFEKLEGKEVSVVGRIKNIRKMGKIGFVVIKDESDSLQLFLSESELGVPDYKNSELGFSEINLLDSGDFVEGNGEVFKTQTGEISIKLKSLRILTKALRPMPLAHEEFSDKEQRLRRRYIDLNVNREVHDRFIRRSKFWESTRQFLIKEGFLEINTPILEHTTGGADANPFVTHMDALDQDFYLRISHELPLKRLIGGGYEKVFDIGPRFRNENYSDEHLPEHVAMEWYWAYADWQDGMKMMEGMFRDVLQNSFGKLKFEFQGKEVDMSGEWEKWDYAEVLKKHYGIDVFDCTIEQVAKALKENKLEVEKTDNIPRGIDKLWKNIRKDVAGPVWLINTPTFISPLSKASDENPNYVQRFQAVIMGSELANGWSELNDPIDQLDRFLEQQQMRDSGDEEAQMLDIDYVEMLEYGMPPACGLGFSERVFWMFEGVSAREGVIFPQLRQEIDETTKKIYPEVYANQKKNPNKMNQSNAERAQDFSSRIVAIVNKDLEPWKVANAVAHMEAVIGNELPKDKLTSGDYFVGSDSVHIPRNSQYPIIIKRADEKELHRLLERVKEKDLLHHVFIKEMQDTNDDLEIVNILKSQKISETNFYGVSFFAENSLADELSKKYQLWNG